MKRWMRRLALAVVLGLSAGSAVAAQEPPIVVPAPSPARVVSDTPVSGAPLVIDGTTSAPCGAGQRWRVLNLFKRQASYAGGDRKLHTALNQHGYGCAADPSIPGCSSLRQDLRFIFGSCRSFFGEPCLPNPPRGERHGLDH